jgi:hypothetical protein
VTLRLALVAALALLAAGGCGGDDEPSEAYRNCQAREQNIARADALRLAYEQDRLGTQAEVSAEFPGGGGDLFDDDGRMIPYQELPPQTRARFDRWAASGEIPSTKARLEMAAAEEKVKDAGWPGCEDLE